MNATANSLAQQIASIENLEVLIETTCGTRGEMGPRDYRMFARVGGGYRLEGCDPKHATSNVSFRGVRELDYRRAEVAILRKRLEAAA